MQDDSSVGCSNRTRASEQTGRLWTRRTGRSTSFSPLTRNSFFFFFFLFWDTAYFRPNKDWLEMRNRAPLCYQRNHVNLPFFSIHMVPKARYLIITHYVRNTRMALVLLVYKLIAAVKKSHSPIVIINRYYIYIFVVVLLFSRNDALVFSTHTHI